MLTWPILGARSAVLHVALAVRQPLEQEASFLGERVLACRSAHRKATTPDAPTILRQRVEHRQDRCHPDPGAKQNDRPITGPQNEAAPRSAYLKKIAPLELGGQVIAGGALGLLFDAEAITLIARPA